MARVQASRFLLPIRSRMKKGLYLRCGAVLGDRRVRIASMNYKGVIIEESLKDASVLRSVKVLWTEVEPAAERHKTPWVSQWTKHVVLVPENEAERVAELLSKVLDPDHAWYADFKNEKTHYVIFLGKVFRIDRRSQTQYDEAKKYGMSLGIPEYNVDFDALIG